VLKISFWEDYLFMLTTQTSNQSLTSQINWKFLVQLVLSVVVVLLLLGLAAIIAITSVFQYYTQGVGSSDLTQAFMIASRLAFLGILVLPSAWYAWKQLSHPGPEPVIGPEPDKFGTILTILVLVVVPSALWLGNWISQNDQLTWFLLPLLNILVNGLSAFWVIYIGIRGLNPGSPRRIWGVFASGLVLSPGIILITELFALLGFGILAILWAVVDPGISNQLQNLIIRLQSAYSNPETFFSILLPFLLKPGILLIAFAFISVIVPIIEEALKPIGVWFLAGQKINPVQGFAFGVLCGAGFGLFENLGNTSAGGEMWSILAATRITTLLLHSLTTGLMGWALATAWSEKRYLRLGITFGFVVLIHGLWNGMAVLSAISSLEGQTNIEIPAYLLQIGRLASIGIIVLGAFNLVLYIGFNAILRNDISKQVTASTNDRNVPDLIKHRALPLEQSELIPSPALSSSPPVLIGTSPLSSGDSQNSTTEYKPPTNTES
jgi:hypothetical protein